MNLVKIGVGEAKLFFMILPSKFAFWVNLNPTLWVATVVRGVNPSKWQLRIASSPIKLKNSILVGSVLVHPAKDLLLKVFPLVLPKSGGPPPVPRILYDM